MGLNGIDISNWQSGISPSAMVGTNFVIVKATQGTYYTSPAWQSQARQTLSSGRLLGLYMYATNDDPVQQAARFLATVKPYVGRAVLAVDWEQNQNSSWGDMSQLGAIVRAIKAQSGVTPLVYAQASAYAPVSAVAKQEDAGMWVAQYASMAPTGYQSSPWDEGAYACAIRQYSSNGRVAGYAGPLDLDLAYMDAAAWAKYASPNGSAKPIAPSAPVLNLEKMADDVIAGKYGDGQTRKAALGANYERVQAIVTRKLSNAPHPTGGRVYIVRAGDTLSGIASRYGTTWQHLQQLNGIPDANLIRVGQSIRIDAPAAQTGVYTVRAGDTLGAIAARLGTTWQHLQQLNGIPNANRIWPGQQVRY